MIEKILLHTKDNMMKKLKHFNNDLLKIRTGRAHPSILENIKIDYYGIQTPIAQVCNITIHDSNTLIITPWDKNILLEIEKKILMEDLGLNPVNFGDKLRIPIPYINEERRHKLIKLVRKEGEKYRIIIRQIRRDSISNIKKELKLKSMSEDMAKKYEEKIHSITKSMIIELDSMIQIKEKDLMVI